MIAPLPFGSSGDFGPELRRFVLEQCQLGAVTMPRLMAQLQGLRLRISKRQMMRLLISGQEHFLGEAQEVLRAASVNVPAASFVARATTIRSPQAPNR